MECRFSISFAGLTHIQGELVVSLAWFISWLRGPHTKALKPAGLRLLELRLQLIGWVVSSIQATGSQGRTEDSTRVNQVYCQNCTEWNSASSWALLIKVDFVCSTFRFSFWVVWQPWWGRLFFKDQESKAHGTLNILSSHIKYRKICQRTLGINIPKH